MSKKIGWLIIGFTLLICGCEVQSSPIPPQPSPVAPTPINPGKPVKNYAEFHSDEEYNKFKEKFKRARVVEVFSATWCGPCRNYAPTYKKVADQNKHVFFAKIDVDDCPNAAKINGVTSLPTTIIRGEKIIGGQSEQQLTNFVLKYFPVNKTRK